ncbi:G2/mitotic-specific cyclin S13-6 [Senna tora]|uniref:G2/mitotic-specific cyclin S13-6 n=1 Tax=Senna tora TaxID=362788 RepID=A0A834TCB6_9FABA|nr:G2/mitotic-specific cyclin S13-6 [Senna tora]
MENGKGNFVAAERCGKEAEGKRKAPDFKTPGTVFYRRKISSWWKQCHGSSGRIRVLSVHHLKLSSPSHGVVQRAASTAEAATIEGQYIMVA